MLFLGVILYIFNFFLQPQCFIPAVKGWQVDKIVMGTVIILWIIGMLKAKKMHFFNAQQNKLMIMFYFVIVISTLSVNWLTYSFNTFIGWGKVVLIYFALINIVNSYKKLKTIIWVAVLSLSITALLGILQKYGIDYFGTGLDKGRIQGVGIFNMNQLAHVLAFLIPMILYLFSTTKNIFLKLILLIISLEYYYAIFLTESRAGLLCVVITIFFFFVFFTKSKLIKIFGFVISIVLFTLLLQLSPRLQTISTTEVSAKGRLDAWGDGLVAFKSSPFLGVGKDQFTEHAVRASHNSYVQTLTELGIFGLFIWLALFYFSFKNLRYISNSKNKLVTKNESFLSKCFQISLYAYLINSFFSGSAYYEQLYIMFALIVVLQILTNINNLKGNRIFIAKDMMFILFVETAIVLIIRLLV
jgi:O-antigen ligase